jgi:hypothetical protein
VLSAIAVQPETFCAGTQLSHPFPGFFAPAATTLPPISHPSPQTPLG